MSEAIDINQLPIPNWGLLCPQCRYPLRGLPSHRCPECGAALNMKRLVRTWTRLRPPRFCGQELPVPDFGLTCTQCDGDLVGATSHVCPRCDRPFEPEMRRPREAWFALDERLCREVPVLSIAAVLGDELVPYVSVGERGLGEIYGGQIVIARLRVPSEFYFDALWLIQRARKEMAVSRSDMRPADWKCPRCREVNPGNFEVCWNCGSARARPAWPPPSEP